MKSFSFLAILPCASVAFQQAAPVQHRQATALNYFPEKFKEAELCATEYGECSLAEMEYLAAELNQFQHSEEGELQNRDDYEDTRRVTEMLLTQTELKHKMETYKEEHHKSTYVEDAWLNNSPGLGLGLW